MATDTRADDKPVSDTQAGAMPTPEQAKAQSPAAEAPAPKTEETAPEAAGTEELTLPEGVSERTKAQFTKLKDQLSEYKKRLFGERVMESMRPKAPAPTEKAEPEREWRKHYDPETGVIDYTALDTIEDRAKAAETRASRSEEAVQSYIDSQQAREAEAIYPEINPQAENFDEKLFNTSRAFLLDSMVYPDNYGGKTLTLKEAADRARELHPKPVPTSEGEAQRQSAKEQASLEPTARHPSRRAEVEGAGAEEELRYRTRMGDMSAAVSRMSKIPAAPASKGREEGT